MSVLPWTYERRPDTRTTSVRLGVWLFLASEAMFFGSLFSAYVLLRTGADTWPDGGTLLSKDRLVLLTVLLLVTTRFARSRPEIAAVTAFAFLVAKLAEFVTMVRAGMVPSANLLIACWFVIAGLHWLHVVGGAVANVLVWRRRERIAAAHYREHVHALWLYWCFVDLVWVAILLSFYFI